MTKHSSSYLLSQINTPFFDPMHQLISNSQGYPTKRQQLHPQKHLYPQHEVQVDHF